MKTYRQMIKTLNACMLKNMWKALLSFLLMSVLETCIMSAFSIPAMMLFSESGSPILTMLLAVLSLYVGFTLVFMLQYGYQVLLLRLLRGDFVTLGFLFNGFRERRRIARASALFSVGLIVALVICQIIAVVLNLNYGEKIRSLSLPLLAGIIFAIYSIISIILLVHFILVWVCLADNPNAKILQTFKMSFKLLKGKCFKLIGFVIFAGGSHLLVALAIFVVTLLVPTNLTGFAGFLLSVAEFVYFIAAYTAAVRMFMAIPRFYMELIPNKTQNEEPVQQLEAPLIQLPQTTVESSTVEQTTESEE